MNKYEKDLEKAQREFELIVGSCYIYLTKNGLKSDFVEDLLRNTMEDIIKQYREIELKWLKSS